MRIENAVHDDIGDDAEIEGQNVIDGVRQAEEEIADEHRQHGPRGLVHHLARECCVITAAHTTLVVPYLSAFD